MAAATFLILAFGWIISAWAGVRGDDSQCANTPNAEAAVAACSRLYENEGLGSHNRAIALGNRGAALKLLGRYDDAIADFTLAISLDPKNPQYYCQRGNIQLRRKAYQEAVDDFTTAIERAPSYILGYEGRGQAYLGLGNAEPALADIDKALRVKPGNLQLLLLRGRANNQAKRYQAAIADFSQALNSKSKNTLLPKERATILSQRGFAFLKQNRSTEARVDVDEALKLGPRSAFALAVSGLIEEQIGHKPEAKESYARALAIEPDLDVAKRGLERLKQIEATATLDTPAELPEPPAKPTPRPTPQPSLASAARQSPVNDLCARYVPAVGQTILVACDK